MKIRGLILKPWHYITTIASVIGIAGALYAPISFLNANYVSAADGLSLHESIGKLNARLDKKIIEDEISAKQNRMWSLQDRCNSHKCDQAVLDEIRNLQAEIDKLKNQ
jgi:hypothetical protein